MPANKDFKRLVRGRMHKTGEAYTTARVQLLKQKSATAPRHSPDADNYAKLAGRSDATLKEKTGCTWERWVGALDRVKAYTWPHRDIAQYVREKYRIPGWWAQTVTVGYERIKGLRAVGQRRDGSFEANKSKTLAVPLSRLYDAFSNPGLRARWLPGIDLAIRTATRDKSIRATWPDRSSVEIFFAGKGPGKSQVALQHGKLPDRASAQRMKQYWTERLDALEQALMPRR
jgi:uncharacterized protein YndB with AHSA1/START domain